MTDEKIETICGNTMEVKWVKIEKGLTRLSFKIVVRTEDERKDIKEIVPVEIVGYLSGKGFLCEDDRVEVTGRRNKGILIPDFVYNLTKNYRGVLRENAINKMSIYDQARKSHKHGSVDPSLHHFAGHSIRNRGGIIKKLIVVLVILFIIWGICILVLAIIIIGKAGEGVVKGQQDYERLRNETERSIEETERFIEETERSIEETERSIEESREDSNDRIAELDKWFDERRSQALKQSREQREEMFNKWMENRRVSSEEHQRMKREFEERMREAELENERLRKRIRGQ